MLSHQIIATLDQKDILNFSDVINSSPDLIEIRLELLSPSLIEKELISILKNWNRPIIFTYRRAIDSNQDQFNKITFSQISELLKTFNSKSNFIDIEFDNTNSIFQELQNSEYQIIYSHHNFTQSISLREMKELIFQRSRGKTEDSIYKFAITPKTPTELIQFLENVRTLSIDYTIIGVAMGGLGLVSRVFGDFYGSSFTYCCIGSSKAPGQISIQDYRNFRKYIS